MSILRHTLATLAYRGGRALKGAPEPVGLTRISAGSRTPVEILTHMGDLMDWALAMAAGHPSWRDSTPLGWDAEQARFFEALKKFDDYLASGAPLHAAEEKLFQGPVADALTHVGQIAMIRRIAGAPSRGENFFEADIAVGRVGEQQAAPRKEFD